MKKFKAKISYTIDSKHPYIQYVLDSERDKTWEYEDTYSFDDSLYDEEDMMRYMKRDLRLIAGGGYNTDHIHNVKFEIERIE